MIAGGEHPVHLNWCRAPSKNYNIKIIILYPFSIIILIAPPSGLILLCADGSVSVRAEEGALKYCDTDITNQHNKQL